MADVTINADEVRSALQEFAASYEPGTTERTETGRVTSAADGIARVEGLPSVMANELLRFENGELGLAQDLDVRDLGVVVLGDFREIEEGQTVERTGEILSVPVGDAFLGRVVDPLGHPIDDLGTIESEGRRALDLSVLLIGGSTFLLTALGLTLYYLLAGALASALWLLVVGAASAVFLLAAADALQVLAHSLPEGSE